MGKAWHVSRFSAELRFLSKTSPSDETAQVLQRLVLEVTRSYVTITEPLLEQAPIDSIKAVEFLRLAKETLGVDLPIDSLYAYPSLVDLADHIDSIRSSQKVDNPVNHLIHSINNPEHSSCSTMTVLVHAVQGDLSPYMSVADKWPGVVLGCQASKEFDSLEAMATAYVTEVAAKVPQGQEVFLGGFCMGAVIARKMVHQALQKNVLNVKGLILLDPPHSGLNSGHMIDAFFHDILSTGELETLRREVATLDDLDKIGLLLESMNVQETTSLLEAFANWTKNLLIMNEYSGRAPSPAVDEVPVFLAKVPDSDYDSTGIKNLTTFVAAHGVDHFGFLGHHHAKTVPGCVYSWMSSLE